MPHPPKLTNPSKRRISTAIDVVCVLLLVTFLAFGACLVLTLFGAGP